MSQRDDNRFHVRIGPAKQRGDRFITKVLRQANKAAAMLGRAGKRPGARLGRGHVAAHFAGRGLGANARRVTIKARLVNLTKAGPRSVAMHLRYIEREGISRQGETGHAYGPTTDAADLDAFKERSADDRHQFRFIVSAEDAEQLDNLRTYTRHLMARMEADLGTRVEWVAVDHWNTDNPHTHIVLRGKDDIDKDLIISPDYIANGMRRRASELAVEWLGPRTELDMQRAMLHEVEQERWTGLDRTLQRESRDDGLVHLERLAEPRLQRQRKMLIGRLQCLERMGLASEPHPGTWSVHAEAEPTLRGMGERGDIIRTMQRAMSGKLRELIVLPANDDRTFIGRIAGKGLADELDDKGYLVVDGTDGRAHYVALPPYSELEQYPAGAVVEVKGSTAVRTADRNIAALTVNGVYRTDRHLAFAQGQAALNRDPCETVAAHVRRLEALRRAGIVERKAEGVWRIPDDLAEQGRRYDATRFGGSVTVNFKSHLPIERQVRVIGATWLDQQLINGGRGLVNQGFGAEVKDALGQRADFLIEQGLAERRGQRVVLARNLLATLRGRELGQAAKDIAAETGLAHRPVADGQQVAGIYRRSILLASGRYAMLDDGMGFSLVPWKPVIDSRIGKTISTVVCDGIATWDIRGRSGPTVG